MESCSTCTYEDFAIITHPKQVHASHVQSQPGDSLQSPIASLLIKADQRKRQGLPVYNFAVGNPSMEPPGQILESMIRLLEQARDGSAKGMFRYMPPAGHLEFREAIAKFISPWQRVEVPAECVVAAPGAQSAMTSLLGSILSPGDVVLLHKPCYPDYIDMVGFWKGEFDLVDFDPETFDIDMRSLSTCMERAAERLCCVVICSPGNPTGKVISADTMRTVAQKLTSHQAMFGRSVWLISDNTYWRLTFDAQVPSCFEMYQDSVVISSFSKDMSLAGERLGFAAVNPRSDHKNNIVASMGANSVRLGNLSSPAFLQHVISDVLQREGRLPCPVDGYRPRVAAFRQLLLDAGMRSCRMPDGAFYLFPRLPLGIDDVQFCIECSRRGVYALPGSTFASPDHVRCAAVPDLPDIERGASIMRSVLQSMLGTRAPGCCADADIDETAGPQVREATNSTSALERSEPSTEAPTSQTCRISSLLPLDLLRWDHYTLICGNARKVAEMHCDLLGFEQVRIQNVNTGTVSDDEVDMCNYILKPPAQDDASRVLVVTEGLNEDTVFSKYLAKFGPGIHHVAYQVGSVDEAFSAVRAAGYETTSDHVMHDMLTGLKQFFIVPRYTGYFIELIERPDCEDVSAKDLVRGPVFTGGNMAGLANSIASHVETETQTHLRRASTISVHAQERIDVGPVRRLRTRSPDPAGAAQFLCEVLGFRFLQTEHVGGEASHRLNLPREPKHVVSAELANPGEQPGVHCLDFAVRDFGRVLASAEAAGFHALPCSQPRCLRCARLPSKRHPQDSRTLVSSCSSFSYDVGLLAEPTAALLSWPVSHSHGSAAFSVQIQSCRAEVVAFLADLDNLSQWTGHKGVHRVCNSEQFVEVRIDKSGGLVRTTVEVDVSEDAAVSMLTFLWVDLDFRVVLEVADVLGCQGTRVTAIMPRGIPARRQAELTRLLGAELSILKALLEGNAPRCVSRREWEVCDSYHLQLLGAALPSLALPQLEDFRAAGVRGEVLDFLAQAEALSDFTRDFALVRRAEPLAVIRPRDAEDLAAIVAFAGRRGLRIGARGGRTSHSAGGQALAGGGLVLDMSSMCGIEFDVSGSFVDAGGGASWNDVVSQAVQRGLAPPVVTDYQYLSVGGTISMGGFGFMSHREGLQASHVTELDVVTGTGAVVTCYPEGSPDLFHASRAGLGQFGVIARARIPLRQAPTAVHIVRMFYFQSDVAQFVLDCDKAADGGADLIHAFLKPRTREAVIKALGADGADAYRISPPAFRAAVEEDSENERGPPQVLFYLELGLYDENAARQVELVAGLSPAAGFFSTDTLDYITYVTRDPPVIEINRERGPMPHPSIALTLSGTSARRFIQLYLDSERGPAELTEVLITPLWRASSGHGGLTVPMSPLPDAVGDERLFFVLVLGSAVPDQIDDVHSRHLALHKAALRDMGAKRYPYDTVEVVGEPAWAAHFGEQVWGDVLECKKKYDPLHVFSPGVRMFG